MRPNRPKVSVDQAPNRIEFSIRFDLMPIAKRVNWSPALLCQVFDSFSLVTSLSWHHVWQSHTSEDLSEVWQGQIEASIRLGWRWFFFYFGRRFSAGTWPTSVHEWARGVGHGITSDRGLVRRSPPDLHSYRERYKEHFFGTQGLRFSTARHQSSRAGHAIEWSIIFLFAERNFRLCVNRNIDTIFDPVLPEPSLIFGLLNLSNIKKEFCTPTDEHLHVWLFLRWEVPVLLQVLFWSAWPTSLQRRSRPRTPSLRMVGRMPFVVCPFAFEPPLCAWG